MILDLKSDSGSFCFSMNLLSNKCIKKRANTIVRNVNERRKYSGLPIRVSSLIILFRLFTANFKEIVSFMYSFVVLSTSPYIISITDEKMKGN